MENGLTKSHPLSEILALCEILVLLAQVRKIQVNELSDKTLTLATGNPLSVKLRYIVSTVYRDITSLIGLSLFDGNSVLFPMAVRCTEVQYAYHRL